MTVEQQHMAAKGIDYAWADPKPATSCLTQNGVTFIARYFSYDLSKDLTQAELNNAVAAGIDVVVVWETTANRMLGGRNAGVSDAKEALRRADALGMTNVPIYFACDWDATESEQAAINAYMDGVISVIGKARAGIYAGYYPGKRTLDAGKATYLWQTYAWSGGQWDARAQLRQVQNGVTVCGTSADWDESWADNYGQWPLFGAPPAPEVKPPPTQTVPPLHVDYFGPANGHNYRCADVRTWQQQMHNRGWTISVDGVYGPQSETVCRQFQAEKHLSVDGLVGPNTWKASWTAPVT